VNCAQHMSSVQLAAADVIAATLDDELTTLVALDEATVDVEFSCAVT
jgi:hypothetical protein